jgi:hypothetical protein
MRKPVIENIEIVEPPVGELSRQQGSFKKTCLTGCGCVIFLVIAVVGALRFFIGSGPSTLTKLPANFPTSIPVYEKDSIESITYISGVYKHRSTEIAAFFPKVILSPMLMHLQRDTSSSSTGFMAANRNFWSVLTTPVSDSRDTIIIKWANIESEPDFIISYYRKELNKNDYELTETENNDSSLNFSFQGQNGVSGTLIVDTSNLESSGTDYAALTVSIPASFENPPEKK